MNEMQKFIVPNSKKEIRVITIDNEPWFVGKDVAEALGYNDLSHAILDHVDEEDRTNSKTQGQNAPEFGQRGTWLINESGLYSLILSSKLPSAKQFKRWVTSEVLPAIRKTGYYSMNSYLIEDPIERAKRWIQEQEEKKALE
jgi:anti-repressor protein